MKLHFTNDWLRRKIASDPDNMEIEAGSLKENSDVSWSFNAVGKPEAVVRAAKAAMEKGKCIEPEESYRLDCLGNIMSMASQQVGQVAISVVASGSMWKDGDVVKSHTMSLEFKPLSGFVE